MDDLDDGMTKEHIIFKLYNEMMPGARFEEGSERISKRASSSRRLLVLQYVTVAFIYILLHAKSLPRAGMDVDFALTKL